MASFTGLVKVVQGAEGRLSCVIASQARAVPAVPLVTTWCRAAATTSACGGSVWSVCFFGSAARSHRAVTHAGTHHSVTHARWSHHPAAHHSAHHRRHPFDDESGDFAGVFANGVGQFWVAGGFDHHHAAGCERTASGVVVVETCV